jgi:hypothetical protein
MLRPKRSQGPRDSNGADTSDVKSNENISVPTSMSSMFFFFYVLFRSIVQDDSMTFFFSTRSAWDPTSK